MKHIIVALLLIATALSQTRVPSATLLTPPPTLIAAATASSFVAASPSTPDASIALDTSTSDAVPSSQQPASTVTAFAYIAPNQGYSNANNAWNYLQKLKGGCCNNCNNLCGLAIKMYGTNYYLTNKGTYYQFVYTTTSLASSQIFSIGQNVDCTWSISNAGSYLSTSSIYSGQWVGPSTTLGTNERWYIERSGLYVYLQSASLQYYYWRASVSPFFLGYSNYYGTRLTFEYYPCDKTFGWN
jgi:hypothetical protein